MDAAMSQWDKNVLEIGGNVADAPDEMDEIMSQIDTESLYAQVEKTDIIQEDELDEVMSQMDMETLYQPLEEATDEAGIPQDLRDRYHDGNLPKRKIYPEHNGTRYLGYNLKIRSTIPSTRVPTREREQSYDTILSATIGLFCLIYDAISSTKRKRNKILS